MIRRGEDIAPGAAGRPVGRSAGRAVGRSGGRAGLAVGRVWRSGGLACWGRAGSAGRPGPFDEAAAGRDRRPGWPAGILWPRLRGRSVVVAQKPSKLLGRVRFPSPACWPRGVAQSGSAPGWGPGGRRFKSCLPDSKKHPAEPLVFKLSGAAGSRVWGASWEQFRSKVAEPSRRDDGEPISRSAAALPGLRLAARRSAPDRRPAGSLCRGSDNRRRRRRGAVSHRRRLLPLGQAEASARPVARPGPRPERSSRGWRTRCSLARGSDGSHSGIAGHC